MADLGLDIFDRTVHETNHSLQNIMQELNEDDRQVAYHALRAVLFSLRDRLTTELAAAFGAQLPLLVRGIYYEGYRPSDQPEKYRTLDEWNQHVHEAFQPASQDLDPEAASTAVFRMLNEELDHDVLEKVHAALPEDVRALWPELELQTT